MKKVLITGYSLEYGGIEKSLIEFLKQFCDEYEITLMLQEKSGPLLNEVPVNVVVKEYKLSKSKNVIFRKIYNRVKLLAHQLFKRNSYDVAIAFAGYDIASCYLVQALGKKSVMWTHTDYAKIYKPQEFKEFYEKRKYENFDRFAFVSCEGAESFTNVYPNYSEKVMVANNTVNFDDLTNKSLLELPLQNDMIHILFVGRLDEESKRLSLLIESMKFVDSKKYQLTIIGDGPDKENYIEQVKSQQITNIEFLGAKENPYPYMKNADTLVLTSNYEGFPVVCIEGLHFGLRIISTIDVRSGSFKLSDYATIVDANPKDIADAMMSNETKEEFNSRKYLDETLNSIRKVVEYDEV